MKAREVATNRWVPLAAMVLMGLAVVVPWVQAGSVADITEVSGIEIPVVGISTVFVCVVGAFLALFGALRKSAWWWVALVAVAGLITTVTSLWLVTLDVIDSGAVRAIRKVLPESIRDTSPTLTPHVGLWAYLIVSCAVCALAARFAFDAANARWLSGNPEAERLPVGYSGSLEAASSELWDD